jgi:thioredoxin 1
MAVAKVSDASFESDVLKSDEPVLVDFWAEWCGPCRMVAPVLEEVSGELEGKLKVVKLNVDENPQTAARFNVLSIPMVVLFEGGEPQQAVIGARPKAHYEGAWERWLNAA